MTLAARQILQSYYDAFNAGDVAAMSDCLHEDFIHYANEGDARPGKQAFAEFSAHMSETYKENLTDMVIFTDESGTRGAAEFTVNGTYLKTDPGLPEARCQTYRLPAGAFFTLKDGLISRVTTYYNLQDWMAQVSA
ncbi:ketosteroid isomerase-related protein [Pararhodobacter oceanensis]|uniref:ketosteroid isomerase-related protein n=1 Tax=Pararhodobacter oceanensis TaxID=2172121 RepID=UPI003A920951